MCSITGSFILNKAFTIANESKFRGKETHSIYGITNNGKIKKQYKTNNHELDEISILRYHDGAVEPLYNIIHQQSITINPKNNNLLEQIHPAEFNGSYLWHNGIIRPRYIDVMKKELLDVSNWDTKLLCKMLNKKGFDCLSNIDGSFACIYIKNDIVYIYLGHHLLHYI
jgi:hypothetical protein